MDHHCRILFILTKLDIKSEILAAKDLIIITLLTVLKSKPRKFTFIIALSFFCSYSFVSRSLIVGQHLIDT